MHIGRWLTNTVAALMALAGMAAVLPTATIAQESGPAYVVSYLEVLPARHADARTELLRYRDKAKQEPGYVSTSVLERADKPNHFAILESWRDPAARDAHRSAAEPWRTALKPLLTAPYDERPHTGLAVGESKAGTILAVTHVDIVPDRKDIGISALRKFAEGSRSDGGLGRFDVLQQNSRPNHFTLVEAWADRTALEGHAVAAHTRAFREELMPMSGSLYDERLYRVLE